MRTYSEMSQHEKQYFNALYELKCPDCHHRAGDHGIYYSQTNDLECNIMDCSCTHGPFEILIHFLMHEGVDVVGENAYAVLVELCKLALSFRTEANVNA